MLIVSDAYKERLHIGSGPRWCLASIKKKYEVTHFDASVSLFEVFWGSLTVVRKKLECKIGQSSSGWTGPQHLSRALQMPPGTLALVLIWFSLRMGPRHRKAPSCRRH